MTTTPWTPSTPVPFGLWNIDQGDTQRITEDGRLRITEDGLAIRIIERTKTTWTAEPPPYGIWTKE